MRNINFAILDQCVISGTNFFISLILARTFSPSEFGLYVFTFTTLVLATNLMNSIISVPLSVIGASAAKSEWQKYLHNSFAILVVVSALIVTFFSLIYLSLKDSAFRSNANIVGMLGAIIFFYLAQEYIRRCLITRLQTNRAFIVDLVTYAARLGLVILLVIRAGFGCGLVIAVFGLTSFLGLIVGLSFLPVNFAHFFSNIDKKILMNLWNYGKWTLADMVPFLITGSLNTYIVAFVIGNEANGVIGACRNLIGPVTILLVGIMNFALPYYSKVYQENGYEILLKILKMGFVLVSIAIIFYLTVVNIFSDEILHILFQKYTGYAYIVFLFSLGALINFIFKPADIYFKVVQKPKIVFISRSAAAAIIAAICYPVVFHYGVTGAAYTEITSQTIMAISLYVFMSKDIKKGYVH